MEECLLRRDSSHLVSVLHYEGLTSITLTRLDQVVTKVTRFLSLWIRIRLQGFNMVSESRFGFQNS